MVFPLLFFVGFVWSANQAPPYDHTWCWEGKPCTDSSQCKQPSGEAGHCCNGMCREFKLNRGDICGSSLTDSGCPSCGDNLKCVDSGAGKFLCEQQDAQNGCLCNSTGSGNCVSSQPCLPSGFCGAANVLPGGNCEVTSQCWKNSACNATTNTCMPVPDGQNCGTTPGTQLNPCRPGSVCFANGNCNPVVQFGANCAQDYECAQPNLWCSNKKCANRTAIGGNCTDSSECVIGGLCNSGTCVTPRSVASNSACSDRNACMSGYCNSGTCTPTHFKTVGQACAQDLDCDFGASCQKQICTASGLNMPCDPTLGGADMAAQCAGSLDLYCPCSGVCSPTDAAILPTGATQSDCELAKQAVSKMNLKDVSKLDVNSLSLSQRHDIATFQCCTQCNKGARVSSVGFMIDCVSKTLTQVTVDYCGLYSPDPLALQNCPSLTASSATHVVVSPIFFFLFLYLLY